MTASDRSPAEDALAQRVDLARSLAAVPAREALCVPTAVDIEAWDHVGDPIAEALVRSIRAHKMTRRDVVDAARVLEAEGDPAALTFFADVTHVPAWANFEAMRAGAVLGRRSPLGMAFGAHGGLTLTYFNATQNQVFAITGRMMPSGDYERRLWETSTGTVGALDYENLRPNGPEWERWLRIRIMHTRVRLGLLSSGKWTADEAPVSAAATAWGAYALGTYRASLCAAFAGGTDEEIESFALAWRWIAKLLGAPPELLGEDPTTQLHMELRLTEYFYDPDRTTRELTAAGWVGLSRSFLYSLLPRPAHEAIGRYALETKRRYPPSTYRLVAEAQDQTLTDQLARTVEKTRHLPEDFGIPKRPALTRLVSVLAVAMRTITRATELPRTTERRNRMLFGLTTAIVRRGLSGSPADYDVEVDLRKQVT